MYELAGYLIYWITACTLFSLYIHERIGFMLAVVGCILGSIVFLSVV